MIDITSVDASPSFMTLSRRLALLASSTLLALSVVVLPHAQSVADDGVPETGDALTNDLQQFATDKGISFEEASRRYADQDAVGEFAAQLMDTYPDRLAGISYDPMTQVTSVSFKGGTPAGLADTVAAFPVLNVVVLSASLTLAEVDGAVKLVHNTLRLVLPEETITSEFDHGTIRVGVELSPIVEALGVSRLIAAAFPGGTIQVAGQSIPIDVTVGVASVGEDDVIRGGALLGGSSSSSFSCTSGWPVRESGTTRVGLVTADHCPNSMSYSGRNVLTYRVSVPTGQGDIQFMSSSESVGNEFYTAVGVYREVTGRGTPVVGMRLCKFGRTTGNTCDDVRATGTCRNSYCNLVSMQNRKADSGDSGGPWYSGNTAYGVHSGGHTASFKMRDQFTPLHSSLPQIGVIVKYTP